jgi:hypothetical protein
MRSSAQFSLNRIPALRIPGVSVAPRRERCSPDARVAGTPPATEFYVGTKAYLLSPYPELNLDEYLAEHPVSCAAK